MFSFQNGEELQGSAVISESESHVQSQEHQDPPNPESHAVHYSPTYVVMGLVCASLWSYVVYTLAQYELAGPFILVTVFICLIYFGTSSGRKRKKTELSAYSVFNPNCVRLKGTFTAEQFENELLRRPLDSKTS